MFMNNYLKKQTIFERIQSILNEKGIEAVEFQRKIKLPSQQWTHWKNRGVPSKYHLQIAKELNVNVDWLVNGIGNKYIKEVDAIYAVNKKDLVPLISYVQAGAWCCAIDNFMPGDAEMWMPCPSAHGPHTYALRVRGDSMTSPYIGMKTYPDGTIIYVDPEKEITNGCRVIAKLIDIDEVTFKEYREDAGKHLLKPLNPQYPIQEITENVIICGVIVGQYIFE